MLFAAAAVGFYSPVDIKQHFFPTEQNKLCKCHGI